MTPAGLAGIGFFAITLLTGELAVRLAREEQAARGSLELARQQAQLNRLVIEEMVDGVLVIDRRARVRAANPAARRLLAPQGLGRAAPFQLQDEPAWAELAGVVQQAFDAVAGPRARSDLTLHFSGGMMRTLRLRARFTRPRDDKGVDALGNAVDGAPAARPSAWCSSKTCAACRRAPDRRSWRRWAACRPASPTRSATRWRRSRRPTRCCAEEAVGAEQQMLTAMVADNVERLKRLVDDVMEVAPGIDAAPRAIDLGAEVGRIVADWARTSHFALGAGSRLAGRFADTSRAGAVRSRAPAPRARQPARQRAPPCQRSRLVRSCCVPNRSAARRPGCRWPATATRSRPTSSRICSSLSSRRAAAAPGLGLYICRELCERYGGSIDYWQHR